MDYEGLELMAGKKMHDGEIDINVELVHRLLLTQFPHLCDRPLNEVRSTGTVNAIYRLGDDLCVRLPRVQHWVADLEKELEWLPKLARHLPLAVPEPVAKGEAGSGYPFPWAIYRWIQGETFATDRVGHEHQAAADLAQFVAELRRIDPSGAPRSGRKPLRQLDEMTRAALESLRGVVATDAATAAWESSLQAPAWDGSPVWRHCDLLAPNLLVEGGRLKAVIDFGGAGIGDPALDVIPAWSVFGKSGRIAFRSVLDIDEGTWARARGFALHQALLIIPYYPETNPGFVAMAKRTVQQVLDDLNA
jgi:aminoglycoside phosphotransferase (APT) family kinase protein